MADASQLMSVSVSAFDSVLDASPDAVLALTVDGRITAANAAAPRLFGLSKEGLAGAAVVRLLPEGFDAASVRTQLTANPAGHPLFLNVMAVHEDGTAFSAEVACALHPGGTTTVRGWSRIPPKQDCWCPSAAPRTAHRKTWIPAPRPRS
ncbi:PAS domain S-box protein [Arthrobacter ulcerisalmonis]|uniref:PAS domain S-box protein n=1 Tax=Arthrobacter ulcerisalmonis TaxID=2483813 RepID=UPI003637272E